MQRSIFGAGFTDFNILFHQLDGILNSIKLPLIFFIAGTLYSFLLDRPTFKKLNYSLLDYLIYPFVIWTILQGFVQIIFSGYTGVNTLLTDIYFNLSYEPSNHLGLIIEITTSIILIHLISLISRKKTLTFLILISLAISSVFAKQIGFSYPISYFPLYGFFLFSGLLSSEYLLKKNVDTSFKRHTLVLFLSSIALWVLCAYISKTTSHINTTSINLLNFLSSVFSISIIATGLSLLPSKNAIITKLIAANFSAIFLMHEIFGHGARQLLVKSLQISDTYSLLLIVCACAIITPLIISQFIFKKHTPWIISTPNKISSKTIYDYLSKQFKRYTYLPITSIIIVATLIVSYTWINYSFNHLPNPLAKEVGLSKINLSTHSKDINEGRRLSLIFGCYSGCHGADMQGINFSRSRAGGILYSSNLTHAIDKYTASELADIVRAGTFPDGKIIKEGMPYSSFNLLNDKELSQIFSFIKSAPKHAKKTQASVIGLPNKLAFLAGNKHLQGEHILASRKYFKTSTNPLIAKGERLTRIACAECHGDFLNGGSHVGAPSLITAKAYSYSQFKRLLQTGEKLNNKKARLMGSVARIRYSNFKEEEIKAIYQFLTNFDFSASNNS